MTPKLQPMKNVPTMVKDTSLVEKRRRQIVDAAIKLFKIICAKRLSSNHHS